jgi:hypothetical protein
MIIPAEVTVRRGAGVREVGQVLTEGKLTAEAEVVV